MRYLITLLAVSASIGLTACGDEQETCGVNSYGNKLCGNDALTYCEVIGGFKADAPQMTKDTCDEIAHEYDNLK